MIHLQQPLTKETFWNPMMEKYPLATAKFCEWIDEYKIAIGWKELFNDGKAWAGGITIAPKYHDLPQEMQIGIWFAFTFSIDGFEWYSPSFYEDPLEKQIEEFLSIFNERLLEE